MKGKIVGDGRVRIMAPKINNQDDDPSESIETRLMSTIIPWAGEAAGTHELIEPVLILDSWGTTRNLKRFVSPQNYEKIEKAASSLWNKNLKDITLCYLVPDERAKRELVCARSSEGAEVDSGPVEWIFR